MMKTTILADSKGIYFAGIGGISMSALAKLCLHSGYRVCGSDMTKSSATDELSSLGVKIYIGHSKENVKNADCDILVYTAAIKKDNEEIVYATKNGMKLYERSEFLGALMKNYKCPINISGTHGKTTTTSMISGIFIDDGLNPTITIGGNFDKIGGNLKIGGNEYLICEACEYVDSFLKFNPTISVVLNVDEDHLDYFSSIEDIKKSFLTFINLTHSNGTIIVNADDDNIKDLLKNVKRKVLTFGIDCNCDLIAENLEIDDNGFYSYDAVFKGVSLGRISLKVIGIYNVYNSLAAALTALSCGIDFSIIEKSLSEFTGTQRRFQYKGKINGASVFDDYAHHPTELKSLITGAKKIGSKNLVVVFQPHTYTRTKALLNEFADALRLADKVILSKIYAAREPKDDSISSNMLGELIENSIVIDELCDVLQYLYDHVNENDLVIVAGAGNINEITNNL